jgi:hypothetical protein
MSRFRRDQPSEAAQDAARQSEGEALDCAASKNPGDPSLFADESSPIETPLPDGGVKLSRRASGRQQERAAGRVREAARIITMVWGERYIDDLLTTTLPALLAPGNIPAFVEHFDAEMVIVTESRFFDLLASSRIIGRMLEYCNVRLLPIDDLLSSWYGVTLTYALVRGFSDLGAAMVDTHLLFINADFILADGSYRKLAEVILRGERLVVSPSYCMVQENTLEQLHRHRDESRCSLAIPHRELAKMIIDNRHNTIRAKTVNQQLFRIHRYDQLYWYVDKNTLLGRQMPIAVVYMRPERVITEMPTFWDYGVISEYCPTTKPCVLGDSDDFLMAELRTEATFRELLHLGWPTPKEIAADLSSFTTQDHRDYGRYDLTLHSTDLPAQLEAEKAKFISFVDDIYRRLQPPVNYRNHPFWTQSFPRFEAARQERERQAQLLEEIEHAIETQPEYANQKQRLAELRREQRQISERLRYADSGYQEKTARLRARLAPVENALRHELEGYKAELESLRAEEAVRLQVLREQLENIEREIATIVKIRDREIGRLQRALPRASRDNRQDCPRSNREPGAAALDAAKVLRVYFWTCRANRKISSLPQRASARPAGDDRGGGGQIVPHLPDHLRHWDRAVNPSTGARRNALDHAPNGRVWRD